VQHLGGLFDSLSPHLLRQGVNLSTHET
jgi:hypothetical protein